MKLSDTTRRVLWTFGMAFAATFLTFATGILAAPDLKAARAGLAAAIVASIAAGLSAAKNAALPPGSAAR